MQNPLVFQQSTARLVCCFYLVRFYRRIIYCYFRADLLCSQSDIRLQRHRRKASANILWQFKMERSFGSCPHVPGWHCLRVLSLHNTEQRAVVEAAAAGVSSFNGQRCMLQHKHPTPLASIG